MNNILISFPDNIEINADTSIQVISLNDGEYQVVIDNVIYCAILQTLSSNIDIFMNIENNDNMDKKFYKTDLVSKILKIIT